ncbi:MAG TPA: methyltransferase domain-containing protein [Parafilimonas sp.]|nr:methyltransferase domain-containing protein [Parafilimonas sp.]
MNWNATLYDQKHSFVAKYGEDLLGWLDAQEGENVLDIGCGTGTLTAKISEAGANVVGIDASPEMITKAKSAFPHIQFFLKDATDFSFREHFDAAFSNATFHWIKEQRKAIQCIYNNLRAGGRFVYEMGAKHNIENIHNALKKVLADEGFEENTRMELNYFSSPADQAVLLEDAGFIIAKIIRFERPTELSGEDGMKSWIIQFCHPFFNNIPHKKAADIIDQSVSILKGTNYENGKWYADYIRLRIKAIKK